MNTPDTQTKSLTDEIKIMEERRSSNDIMRGVVGQPTMSDHEHDMRTFTMHRPLITESLIGASEKDKEFSQSRYQAFSQNYGTEGLRQVHNGLKEHIEYVENRLTHRMRDDSLHSLRKISVLQNEIISMKINFETQLKVQSDALMQLAGILDDYIAANTEPLEE